MTDKAISPRFAISTDVNGLLEVCGVVRVAFFLLARRVGCEEMRGMEGRARD